MVFEDVVDILDPEMNLLSGYQGEEKEILDAQSEVESVDGRPASEELDDEEENDQDGNRLKNPYKWIPRKDEREAERKETGKKKNEKRSSSPSQDEHIKHVTNEFCDWVASLGGESNNIEESTIASLFASGYETKPALSVPIHVVELTSIPMELRNAANIPPPQEDVKDSDVASAQDKKKEWLYSGSYEPTWTKFHYGAWYMNPKTWKKRDFNEPLMDPKELKNQEMSEAKKKSAALDSELAPMHGAKAFMDFIDRKSKRQPEFLDHVAEIQEQQAREEQAKLAAELAKLKRQNEEKVASVRQ